MHRPPEATDAKVTVLAELLYYNHQALLDCPARHIDALVELVTERALAAISAMDGSANLGLLGLSVTDGGDVRSVLGVVVDITRWHFEAMTADALDPGGLGDVTYDDLVAALSAVAADKETGFALIATIAKEQGDGWPTLATVLEAGALLTKLRSFDQELQIAGPGILFHYERVQLGEVDAEGSETTLAERMRWLLAMSEQ
jgi:hypothetical protein